MEVNADFDNRPEQEKCSSLSAILIRKARKTTLFSENNLIFSGHVFSTLPSYSIRLWMAVSGV